MSLVSRTLLVALPLLAGFTISPAFAQQDSAAQQFNDIRNAVGLGADRPPIDFSERPPLVVPPTNNLPPPVAESNVRLPIVDPDENARRKALTDSRRPVPPTDPGASATGLSARAYLVDPPAGMRDPATAMSDKDFDKSGATDKKAAPHRRRAKRKTNATEQAAQ